MFIELYRFLSPARRQLFWVTVALMILGTVAELLSVGAVMPFIDVVLGRASARAFGWSAAPSVSPAAALGLLGAAVLSAGALRLLLLLSSQALAARVGSDMGEGVLLRTLWLPYPAQVQRNSSATLSMVEQVHRAAHLVVLPALQAITSGVIALFLIAALLLIQPLAAIAAGAIMSTSYLLIGLISRRVLRRNARSLSETARKRTQIMQEAAGGIRDILLDRSQAAVVRRFAIPDSRFRQAQMINSVFAQAPRHVVETLAILAMAALTVVIERRLQDPVAALPALGALALGAQRLLPLLQQVYLGWSQATGNAHALAEVLRMLQLTPGEATLVGVSDLSFEDLELDRVTYSHADAKAPILNEASVQIRRGEKVAIVGETGCGKSTLLDLLMGLLVPEAGEVRINGAPLRPASLPAWQAGLAHVPQVIFLPDDTIAANLAFPSDAAAISAEDMRAALRAAALPEFADAVDGLLVRVGERGVQLSGGQRQRIGIARALLRQPQILILDEALSALDTRTETAVLQNLTRDAALTLIVVSHRETFLSSFERVLMVNSGRIISVTEHERSA